MKVHNLGDRYAAQVEELPSGEWACTVITPEGQRIELATHLTQFSTLLAAKDSADRHASDVKEYTLEEATEIAGPGADMLDAGEAGQLLDVPVHVRPVVHCLYDGVVVQVTSLHELEELSPQFMWLSGSTFADVVGAS